MSGEHNHNLSGRRLGIAIILNAIIFIVELAGGIITNSLALISDAMHNLSDFFSLILSYIAAKVFDRAATGKKTYGYVRIEIIVAFINSFTLVLIGIYIIYEAIVRINNPEPVAGLVMLIIASIGFAANTLATLLLKKDADKNLNIKSAYLHLLTDALESLAVIITGLFLYLFEWYILDSIISAGIGLFIIISAWKIVLETVNILTEGTPYGIDINSVANEIRRVPGVEGVHHLHIWSLSSQLRALSAHILIKDCPVSSTGKIIKEIEHLLESKYNINHPTLQFEVTACDGQDILVSYNNNHNH